MLELMSNIKRYGVYKPRHVTGRRHARLRRRSATARAFFPVTGDGFREGKRRPPSRYGFGETGRRAWRWIDWSLGAWRVALIDPLRGVPFRADKPGVMKAFAGSDGAIPEKCGSRRNVFDVSPISEPIRRFCWCLININNRFFCFLYKKSARVKMEK